MMRYAVLMNYRKGGEGDIPFSGTLDECIRWCEDREYPEDYCDKATHYYADEDESCSIVPLK